MLNLLCFNNSEAWNFEKTFGAGNSRVYPNQLNQESGADLPCLWKCHFVLSHGAVSESVVGCLIMWKKSYIFLFVKRIESSFSSEMCYIRNCHYYYYKKERKKKMYRGPVASKCPGHSFVLIHPWQVLRVGVSSWKETEFHIILSFI